MEQGLALLFPLFLGLLQPGRGGRLDVEPPEPEVAVAVGESRQFTCRLACADGRAASVQWRGLDTTLGSVQSGVGSSVLWVHNASLSAAGTRVCVGSCGTFTYQRIVRLLVFGSLSSSAALWTGSLVLGLLLLVFLIYRLWKRCRPSRR
uniref:Mucosal vascular addressin cell adhesion molecule 1 n=1 Tax=Catagonus wagneri TaxID=51154 RepID=A0A8C3VVV6_9CETA